MVLYYTISQEANKVKEDKILKHLPIASRQVKRKMDEVFQKFNLTSTQAFTLKFIEEN